MTGREERAVRSRMRELESGQLSASAWGFALGVLYALIVALLVL